MFSYRHAFHAGNHADVLKHVVLMLSLQHLTQKETPLTVVDTHAGVGLYGLDGEYAQTSLEALEGVAKLWDVQLVSPVLKRYLEMIRVYNPQGDLRTYPGSPLLMHDLCRAQDKLHLFELHPVDQHELMRTVSNLKNNGNTQVHIKDGFSGLKGLLPPPSRRGLVLMDPSYEIKTDYEEVQETIKEALKRFATGSYLIWYPIIALPQAQELPKQLERLAAEFKRSWLHVTLRIRESSQEVKGLQASGMFVINPAYTLRTELNEAMQELVKCLKTGKGAQYYIVHSD
ncbi:MAG: 23S rRNA (adenine(2030)-N(6))-methyltransferase RlmJ [Saezia sp.]